MNDYWFSFIVDRELFDLQSCAHGGLVVKFVVAESRR
jgi:hypothetical protein